jgi:hypothetical protein
MATPTGNENTRATVSGLEDVKKKQGDFNGMLKESINLLKQANKQYETIEARIKSMSEETINVKEIEKEIEKVRTRHFINAKKLQEIEKDISEDANRNATSYMNLQNEIAEHEKEAARARKLGNIAEAELREKIIGDATIQLEIANESLTIEESQLVALREAKRLDEQSLAFAQEKLKKEKEIRKAVGFTGAAMGFFADKLGIGASYQESLVQKAKDLQKVGKELTFGDKIAALSKASFGALGEIFKDPLAFAAAWKAVSAGFDKLGGAAANVGKGIAGLSDESSTIVSGIAGHVSGLLKNIPLVGGLLGGLVEGFASIFDLVVGVENTVIKSGRELGMSRHEAEKMHHEFAAINVTNGDIFVTSRKLLETQVELSKTLGVNAKFTEEQLATSIKLKELAGLENETIAQFAEISKISGKSQEGVVKSVLSQVEGLKKATGISFNQKQILKETASMSGVLGLQFAKYPEKLTKSLLTVKALGLELKDVDALADSFLDFESSISNEMEAQLLTGKNINLSKARELFLTNDLAGAAMEINSQVGSSSEFLKLNRIQAESLAKAFGMSRDQMGDMLKKQEFLSKLGAKDTDNAREQLRLGLEKYKSQKALNEALGDEAYNSLVTASTQEKMAALIEKIKNSIVDFISGSGIMEKIQHFMDTLSDPEKVRAIINKVKGFMASAVEFIGSAAYHIIDALDYIAFGQIPNDFIESIKSGAANMGANIRSIGMGGGESIGANAAASTVAATTPAKAQGGFADPRKYGGRGDTTVINNNISLDASTATKQTVTYLGKDKSQNFEQE